MSGIILAQPQERRRARLANLVLLRRLVDYTNRVSIEKAGAVVVALGINLASDHRLLASITLLPALVGTVLNLLALQVTHGRPRGRLLHRYETHLSTSQGNPRPNLPAVVECIGGVCMVAGAAWAVTDLPDVVRMVYVAVATGYLVAVCSSIFDDNAWYNPAVRSPHWQEIDRILSGVQVCAVML